MQKRNVYKFIVCEHMMDTKQQWKGGGNILKKKKNSEKSMKMYEKVNSERTKPTCTAMKDTKKFEKTTYTKSETVGKGNALIHSHLLYSTHK